MEQTTLFNGMSELRTDPETEVKRSRITRKGALFSLGNVVRAEDLDWFFLTYNQSKLAPHRQFIQAIFNLCTDDPEHITDMETVCEAINKSRPSINKYLKKLKAIGVVEEGTVRLEGTRTRNCYSLVANKLMTDGKSDEVKEVLLDGNHTYHPAAVNYPFLAPFDDDNIKIQGDGLVVFQFFPALRIGTTGKNNQGAISQTIQIGRDLYELSIRAPEGQLIAGVLDLRYLIVVFSLILERIHLHGECGPEFGIRIEEICNFMGKDLSGGNKSAVQAAMQRWKSTEFKITGMPDRVRERYGSAIELDSYFNLFSSLVILSDMRGGRKVPIGFKITLDHATLQRIQKEGMTLVVHRELLQESTPNPTWHAIYYWCRRAVKYQRRAQIERPWSLAHLHREIDPDRRINVFRQSLEEFLQAQAVEGKDFSRYMGYCFRADTDERGKPAYWIWADESDYLVGTDAVSRIEAVKAKTLTR